MTMNFYPRPPRGGRRSTSHRMQDRQKISIHALREEGDPGAASERSKRSNFYPRPPRGGRRGHDRQEQAADGISIHALREEGDLTSCCFSGS